MYHNALLGHSIILSMSIKRKIMLAAINTKNFQYLTCISSIFIKLALATRLYQISIPTKIKMIQTSVKNILLHIKIIDHFSSEWPQT